MVKSIPGVYLSLPGAISIQQRNWVCAADKGPCFHDLLVLPTCAECVSVCSISNRCLWAGEDGEGAPPTPAQVCLSLTCQGF